ncbi:MAG: hypothetical protein ABSG27_10675 [Candidatus Acidiferrales bacterium]|jgi:hypothetical protein
MSWLFKTEEREERRHEREEQDRKRGEATRRMADLFMRRNSMAPAAIIGELERLHEFYAVPTWAPSAEKGGYFYQIATDLSHVPLMPEQTGRLVAMLLWPEFRTREDRSAPSCLVSAAMQNPSHAYIATLSAHLAWLEEEIKPLASGQYRTDLASEIRLTKATIQACRIRP